MSGCSDHCLSKDGQNSHPSIVVLKRPPDAGLRPSFEGAKTGAGAGAGVGAMLGQHAGVLYVDESQSPPGGLFGLSGTHEKLPGNPVSLGDPSQQKGTVPLPVDSQPP